MTSFIIDTNVILRLLLRDNEAHYKKAKFYFEKAAQNKIKLILPNEVLIEAEHVLNKTYKIPREKCGRLLSMITAACQSPTRKNNLTQIIKLYKNSKIDLVDITIFVASKHTGHKILSFDKDFKKLSKLSRVT
jgi:predicted nucleic-acid-binding protein